MNLLDLVQHLGFVQKAPGDNADVTKNRVSAWNMHEAVYLTLGVMPPPKGSNAPLEHFHLLREMRKCQIHEGGQVSNRLRQQVNDLSPAAELDWLRLSRRAPVNAISSQWLHFTVFDIFAVFATTKSMGRTLNAAIRDGLTKSQWSQICVDDYDEGSSRPRNSDTWMTGLLNHAAMNYGATGINSQDVIDAAVRAGKWPAGRIPIRAQGERPAIGAAEGNAAEEEIGALPVELHRNTVPGLEPGSPIFVMRVGLAPTRPQMSCALTTIVPREQALQSS